MANPTKTKPFIVFVYGSVFLISIAIFFIPAVALVFCSKQIQQIIFGIKDSLFFYGLSSPIPAIAIILSSLLLGIALGLLVYLIPYIYLPGFKEYEKKIFKKSMGFYGLENFDSKLDASIYKIFIAFIILNIFFIVVSCLALSDFTAVNERGIHQKYFLTDEYYDWSDMDRANLNIKYHWSDKYNEYEFDINLVLLKDGKKIEVWRDNGITKPSTNEILWLLEKINRENIPIEISQANNAAITDVFRKGSYDFKNRIYPAIKNIYR